MCKYKVCDIQSVDVYITLYTHLSHSLYEHSLTKTLSGGSYIIMYYYVFCHPKDQKYADQVLEQ